MAAANEAYETRENSSRVERLGYEQEGMVVLGEGWEVLASGIRTSEEGDYLSKEGGDAGAVG